MNSKKRDCSSGRGKCSKGGVKIHDTKTTEYIDPNEFYNKLKQQKTHTGILTKEDWEKNKSTENPENNPFSGLDPHKFIGGDVQANKVTYDKNSYETLDLTLENYSREDLLKLFGLNDKVLDQTNLKEAKKIVLKTHPDKSNLDPKFFLFFSNAYKKILSIYEFQNKYEKNSEKDLENTYEKDADNYKEEYKEELDHLFERNKRLKDPNKFNTWFNQQFEKHRLDEPIQNGHGDWLKSDENLFEAPNNVSLSTLNSEIEKVKKEVKTLTIYSGLTDTYSSPGTDCYALLDTRNNFTSGSLFSSQGMGYTDLKQAYAESVIPISESEFNEQTRPRTIEEYKNMRDRDTITPMSKDEAMKELYNKNKQQDEESMAMAYFYAKQAEKNKEKQSSFWSGLQHITNW